MRDADDVETDSQQPNRPPARRVTREERAAALVLLRSMVRKEPPPTIEDELEVMEFDYRRQVYRLNLVDCQRIVALHAKAVADAVESGWRPKPRPTCCAKCEGA